MMNSPAIKDNNDQIDFDALLEETLNTAVEQMLITPEGQKMFLEQLNTFPEGQEIMRSSSKSSRMLGVGLFMHNLQNDNQGKKGRPASADCYK